MSHELEYYDTLRRITRYQTVDQLRRNSEKQFGLSYEEALEFAYENVIQEVWSVLRGKRRPTKSGARTNAQRPASPVRGETDERTKSE